MTVTFITGNQHKVDNLSRSLALPFAHHKLDLDEIQSADPKKVIEHKVHQAFAILGKPVLVEDTSLSFTALGGLPGPLIKFFVDTDNGLEHLCRMLDGFDDRSAFASAIYGYYDGNEVRYFSGRVDGCIVEHPRGEGGFGWDPIFAPDGFGGRTRAELVDAEEHRVYDQIRDLAGLKQFLHSLT